MRPRLCGKPAIQPQTLKSPPRERPATGFWSGDIPKESTACRCVVNSVIALAYDVIAKPFGLIIPVRIASSSIIWTGSPAQPQDRAALISLVLA